MKKLRLGRILLASALVLVCACGGSDESEGDSLGQPSSQSADESGGVSDEDDAVLSGDIFSPPEDMPSTDNPDAEDTVDSEDPDIEGEVVRPGVNDEETKEAPYELEESSLPRTIFYGDMNVTITSAKISQVTPSTYGADIPIEGNEPHLYLTLLGTNTLSSFSTELRDDDFRLDVNGIRTGPVRIYGIRTRTTTIRPMESHEKLIAFAIDENFDFDSSTLVLQKPNAEPGSIPFRGDVPESGYPIALSIGSEISTVTSANPCGSLVQFKPIAAEVDLDTRLDVLLTGAWSVRRTPPNTRFIRVEVQAIGVSTQCGGANISGSTVRIEADGLSFVPINSVIYAVRTGDTINIKAIYSVPQNSNELSLIVGYPGAITNRYLIQKTSDWP